MQNKLKHTSLIIQIFGKMKSREENNRYHISKIDIMLPADPVLYTYIKITNTDEVDLDYNLSIHSMLSAPLGGL